MQVFQRFFSGLTAFSVFLIASAALAPEAQAIKVKINSGIGEISLSVDTTASAGVTVRVAERDYDGVASQSGGPDFARDLPFCSATDAGTVLTGGSTDCRAFIPGTTGNVIVVPENQINYAGGVNADDGRLNFDQGDITAVTLKSLFDVQADLPTEYGELTLFSRILMYYDPILRDQSSYERVAPDDAARRELGRDLKILDLYLSWDYDIPAGSIIGELPINLRVGKLASNNWGESTFSLSGIAAGIVVDVPSSRRAGAQIREIIQTEYMVYGSVGLPFDIGLSAYYQLHHTPWNLDVGGSPTSTSDTTNPGSAINGFLWLSGVSTSGTFRRNCTRALTAEEVNVGISPCSTNSLTHYETRYYDPGFRRVAAEQHRLNEGDLLKAPVSFIDADDQGQWGAQLSYYVDDFYLIPPIPGMMDNGFSLPGIEFTVSYQNVHSRLPYPRIRGNGYPTITKGVTGSGSKAGGLGLGPAGCNGWNAAKDTRAGVDALIAGGLSLEDAIGRVAAGASEDPETIAGLYSLVPAVDGLSGALPAGSLNLDPVHFANYAQVRAFLNSDPGNNLPINNNPLTFRELADSICNKILTQSTDVSGTGTFLQNAGGENLTLQYNAAYDFLYPEDMKIIGIGFNTTIPWLEWGLQGEIAFRPDTPLLQDVTEQIIAVAWAQCVAWGIAPAAAPIVESRETSGTACDFDPSDGSFGINPAFEAQGIIEADMINFTIGTTALYNRSNPIVGFLGADQAVVLMEFNFIYFDELPGSPTSRTAADSSVSAENKTASLHCFNRTGTELPLGGLLGLDGLGDEECTADQLSLGYTILGFMDYNNVFGTAWRLRPQVAVRHGARGNTPTPIPGWREDALTVNASIEAVFQNSWSARLSYTGFFDVGSNDYNSNSGFDTVSFNISYAF